MTAKRIRIALGKSMRVSKDGLESSPSISDVRVGRTSLDEHLADSLALKLDVATRGETNGVASLDSSQLVPTDELGTGTADATKYLRGDRTWQVPGGGGVTATTVEVDLGATPVWEGRFTITDAAITATSKVLCWQAPGPYTGKGTLADEPAMQPISVVSVVPATGSAVAYWQTPPQYAYRLELPSGRRLSPASLNEQILLQFLVARRIGRVRGNVKFSYMVLS